LKLKWKEAAERCTVMIRGYMESIINRYQIMLPVTAGGDSRTLMSATKGLSDRVLYYVNREKGMSDKSLDIRVPKKLFKNLGMDFHTVHIPSHIDPSFEKVYFENNPHATSTFLPHIYNYYLHFSDRVNIPGNIASAAWGVNQLSRRRITIEKLIRYNGVQRSDFVRDYYEQWMKNCHELCKANNLNVINLFYWEERLSNWGNQITQDKDIAQEEFNPYNSRLFNELFLSVPLKYYNEPDKQMHKHIIRSLWPELLQYQFNPTIRTKSQLLLAYLGLFSMTSKLYFRIFGHLKKS